MKLSRVLAAGAMGTWFALAPVASLSQGPEDVDVFPAGVGRDETFYSCTACHGSSIVRQQGMSREQWSATIDYMVERHKMPEPDQALRALIVDYLAGAFPPRQRGRPNPFL